MNRRFWLAGGFAVALTLTGISYAEIGDQLGTVEINQAEKMQMGRVAVVDIGLSKLVELDLTGKVTWEFSIPLSLTFGGKLSHGTDIKWLPDSDNFLLTIPQSGVFEINRKQEIVWKYKSKFISHDADRLPNGNTIFVNGWDGDTDPIVTEVDQSGKVVMQVFADQLSLDLTERRNVTGEQYSNTHTNAVQKLAEGEYLISVRNFNQFLIFKDGKVTSRYKNASRVHDPVPYSGGFLFAIHRQDRSLLIVHQGPGQRAPLFRPEPETWHPLRTLEILHNKNILITGSQEIGQLDQDGNLVWSMKMKGYVSQKSRGKSGGSFIYRAAFVHK